MTSLSSQLSQVAELTRGLPLPLPPLSPTHLLVIFERVTIAWNELCGSQYELLSKGDEPEINALLEARLNGMLATDRIWSQLVSAIARGKESVSYDGAHLEKRPDLSIFLTRKNPSFPLVIECKIVDEGKKKTLNLYCSKGIKRFVNGEYAWASKEAIIIGYVRDSSSVKIHLGGYLTKKMESELDDLNTSAAYISNGAMELSKHQRSFLYPVATDENSPGEISIYHIWLSSIEPLFTPPPSSVLQ